MRMVDTAVRLINVLLLLIISALQVRGIYEKEDRR